MARRKPTEDDIIFDNRMNFAVQLAASKFRAADDKNVPNDRRAL